jgi:hypothetical protein
MEISKHQACYIETYFMQLVEKIMYQQHETVYMYMFVLHSVSIYEAECSCHFLPPHSGKMIQWGALTMVATRTIHIRVQMCNSVLNTGMLETAVATKIIHTTLSDIV